MNAVVHAELTFQMLTLLQIYVIELVNGVTENEFFPQKDYN